MPPSTASGMEAMAAPNFLAGSIRRYQRAEVLELGDSELQDPCFSLFPGMPAATFSYFKLACPCGPLVLALPRGRQVQLRLASVDQHATLREPWVLTTRGCAVYWVLAAVVT